MSKGRAFSLLSGGLDSLLATRLIMDQGIDVVGLHFITPFFGYNKKGQEERSLEGWRRLYGIQARIIDLGEEYFQVVRNPRYGYGKNFNPCIDCKIFLFSKAKELLLEEKRDFLVTGEVLGQRPMSQRRDTLRIVERDSGTEGILLRPLSARNLNPTRPEQVGMVDREKLLNMSGRSRKPQMTLAREMGFRDYPAPAGGCLLTDPILAKRIKKYFNQCSHLAVNDVLLLMVGRPFQFPGGQQLVVGRREAENRCLLELVRQGDVLLKMPEIPGPLGLFRGNPEEDALRLAASIIVFYSKAKDLDQVEVEYNQEGGALSAVLVVPPAKEEEIAPLKF